MSRHAHAADCFAWNCSCQRLSDMMNISNVRRSWGTSTSEQKTWWIKRGCVADPILPGPVQLPALIGPAKDVDAVCYMILALASEQETWDILMQTWPKFSNGHIYRVLAKPGSKDLGVDGREAVNGSGSVDHTRGVIQLPLRESWDTLAIKTLSLWRYLSRSFNSDGWNTRCAWFVKLDTDSWINAPLLEARLGCLSPDRAIYTGFVPLRHVFAWGGGSTSCHGRSCDLWTAGWICSFRPTNTLSEGRTLLTVRRIVPLEDCAHRIGFLPGGLHFMTILHSAEIAMPTRS
eukprot:m.156906 g.156906  ORF g.156906 m.156906 type:complete len:290 (+) comp23642_c1_seq2:2015-2884(+)